MAWRKVFEFEIKRLRVAANRGSVLRKTDSFKTFITVKINAVHQSKGIYASAVLIDVATGEPRASCFS